MAGIEYVEIDRTRIVHNIGVVLASEDEPGAAHVGGELIHLVEAAIDGGPAKIRIPQVADHEVIGLGFGIFMAFQVHTPNPKPLRFKAFHEMPADKTAGSAY